MFLHIMHNDKFNEPFIEFIERKFNIEEHCFIFIGGESEEKIKIVKRKNTVVASKEMLKKEGLLKLFKMLKPYFKESDKVFLHGLFTPQVVLFLMLNSKFAAKTSWIVWGADLYYKVTRKISWKSNLYEFVRKSAIKKLQNIITLTPGDYSIVKEWYNTRANEQFGMYINPVKKEYLDSIKYEEKKEVYIQIGNSADRSNNYFEIIDMLEKYKNENIKIFAPVSYGDKKYALEVKEYGEKKLGDKFIAMLDFMTPEKYTAFLGSIDIVIFNHKRQQGLGNLYALLYLGKKVYIRSDISSWHFFEELFGIKVYDSLKIKELEFNEFKENSKEISEKNKIMAGKFYSDDYIAEVWSKIFNEKR